MLKKFSFKPQSSPKSCSDRQVWSKSVDPDQTAQEQSDQDLHCLPFFLYPLDLLLYGKTTMFIFKGQLQQFFGVSEFCGLPVLGLKKVVLFPISASFWKRVRMLEKLFYVSFFEEVQ